MTTYFDSHHEASNNFYSAGAQRINAYLAQAGLPTPHPRALQSTLIDHFDSCDYLRAKGLQEPNDPSDWHLVTSIGLPESVVLAGPGPSLASDRIEAVAAILNCCDDERMFPTGFQITAEGIRFYSGNAVLAEATRIQYEPYRQDQIVRVTGAFKGIRCRGEEDRIAVRMKSLPGYSEASFEMRNIAKRSPEGCMLLPNPNNWATAMMEVMEHLKTPVKRHVALELVARLFDVLSWQHLVARMGEERVWELPTYLSCNDEDPRTWRFYKTSAQALYSLGLLLKDHQNMVPIVDMVHRSYSREAGMVVAATVLTPTSSGKLVRSIWMCSSLERADPLPGYIRLAEKFWASIDAGQDPMPLIQPSGDFSIDIRTANLRLGSSPDQTVQIGEWWFRIYVDGTTYLDIERFTPGDGRTVSRRIALYKATVRYDEKRACVRIAEDYDNAEVAIVENVGQPDVDRLHYLISNADLGCHEGLWGSGDIRGDIPGLLK